MVPPASPTVFVVGCQRSGTTLMSQIVGAHPQMLLVDETDEPYRWIEPVLRSGSPPLPDQAEALRTRARNKYRSAQSITERSRLVMQTPNLTCRARELSASFPGSPVIYMLRDVRAVVASMARLPDIPFVANQVRFFERAGFVASRFPDEWAALTADATHEDVKRALVARIKMSLICDFEGSGLATHAVKYEELVTRPRETIAAVLDHVGLPFDEQCLAHERLLEGHGPGGTDRTSRIAEDSLDRWRDELSAQSVAAIWEAVGGHFETLGYSA